MKYDYLNAVEQRLKKEKSKKLIIAELEAHISDKIDYYLDLGYSKEEAEKRAIEEMGDPDDTALPLNKLYSSAAQDWTTLIGYVFLILTVVMPFFFEKFDYAGGYYREVYHLVSVDFISLGVVFGYVCFLAFAYKSKDKILSISAAIALLISNLSSMTIFRPAVYSVIKLALSGVNGYIDSVFAYSYFAQSYKLPLTIGSYIIFAVLLAWAIVQFIAIYRQERLLNSKKLNLIIRVIKRAIIVLLCVNVTVMSAATITAAFRLPEKREQLHTERVKMIDDIINTPLDYLTGLYFHDNGCKKLGMMPPLNMYKKEFDELNYLSDQFVYYYSAGNNYFVSDRDVAFYARSDYDLPFDALEKYEIDKELLYSNDYGNLQEFLDEGRYDKAYQVLKKNGDNGEMIILSFYTSAHKTGNIYFENMEGGHSSDLSKYIFRGTDFDIDDIYRGI